MKTLFAALLAIAMVASTAGALDLYWDGGNGNWSDNHWSGGGAWVPGAIAHFGGSAGTVNVSGTIDLSGLRFDVNNYTVAGGTLAFQGGSTIDRTTVSTIATVTSAITGSPTVNQMFNGNKTYWMIGTQNIGMYQGLIFSPDSGPVDLGTVNNPQASAGGDKSGLFLSGSATGNTVDQVLRPGGNYGSVGKDGTGDWTIDGDIQTGFLAIKQGKLAINGTVTASYIQFSMAAGGILAPGASIGTVAFNQYWRNIESGATIEWEFLNNGTAGTTYDQVVLNTGAYWDMAAMTGTDKFNINVVGLGGYSVGLGDTFQLMSGDVRNFDAGKFNITGTNAGSWEISNSGGLLLTSTIPEPATISLVGIVGLGLLAGHLRRR